MPDMAVRTDAERAAYWKLRALTEQQAAERTKGHVAVLQQEVDALRTQGRIDRHLAVLRDFGVDLSQGEWRPDDEAECFVPIGGQQTPPK